MARKKERKWKDEPAEKHNKKTKAPQKEKKKVRRLLPNAPAGVWFCPGCRFFSRAARTCIMCGDPCEWTKTKDLLPLMGLSPFKIENGDEAFSAGIAGLIEAKCQQFGCAGRVVSTKVGPVVTQYDFKPERSTRVNKLKSLHQDLALELKAESVRVAVTPGSGTLGITVPNTERTPILFNDVLPHLIARRNDMFLPIMLGVEQLGGPVVIDLADQPHMLIAGATGTGKSVLLHGIVSSLLTIRGPEQLQLVLIDPKHVELFQYQTVPHLIRPPEYSVYRALDILNDMGEEMKKRMAFLHSYKVQNIREYNLAAVAGGRTPLPYIMIVLDEIAEMILTEKTAIIKHLANLSAMARAAGIHLLAATQRPSVDVLPGRIKINFPARACLRVPSMFDSRTVLDQHGAEQLLSKGDMLLRDPERAGLLRVHAPLITLDDVNRILRLVATMTGKQVPADVMAVGTPQASTAGAGKQVIQ
jgi:S-DNA-T family DNA segregation ATPase FtsK/SpoIIIE